MKTLIIALVGMCLLPGCKKSDTEPASVQVQVSGLTEKTSVSIKITDQTQGVDILNIQNKFGNTTYNTSNANPGDQLTIAYSTNIKDDLAGDGDGTIKFSYKGDQMGATGGILTGTVHETVPMP